eukprot:9037026-Pyramimonas_sp.AAC.1
MRSGNRRRTLRDSSGVSTFTAPEDTVASHSAWSEAANWARSSGESFFHAISAPRGLSGCTPEAP